MVYFISDMVAKKVPSHTNKTQSTPAKFAYIAVNQYVTNNNILKIELKTARL